jgi:hypothetical protein
MPESSNSSSPVIDAAPTINQKDSPVNGTSSTVFRPMSDS